MMSANNIKMLESIIIAMINVQYPSTAPTEEAFNQCAEMMRNASQAMSPVTDEEFSAIKRNLREMIEVKMDSGICLPDPHNGHESWVPARRASTEFFYWNRYKKYLEGDKHWNPRVTAKLGQVSDEILDQCGDPQLDTYHIRGLVLGDVQSGKTANYTAIINKAADYGYELIVVLAGIPEILRTQTQKRLDEEFCGRSSNQYLVGDSIKDIPRVGVAKYGYQKDVVSFTSETSDFKTATLRQEYVPLDSVHAPILFVLKKNRTVLNNLCNWLKKNNKVDSNGQIHKSLLLVDDEADNASVNTKDSTDPDQEHSEINKDICRLLGMFTKTTYLAVTATPFANIFIDPDNNNDLFPADFIYALEAPTNYIGAERIFSDQGDHQDMLVEIQPSDCLPPTHKKSYQVKALPDDLYDAAYYFLLANAVRDYRGDITAHRSMMVHISRFILVQNQIADMLLEWLDGVRSDVQNYAQLPEKQSEKIRNIHRLHEVWDESELGKKSGMTWSQVLKDYLYKAIAPIEVRAINGSQNTTLDYDYHKKDGLRVIAVGGNSLSRGLTLEGLMVTYFCRNSHMYDTLMQMGRWFGYRPNYDDLVKVWLTREAIAWYGQINIATQDLRSQIFEMKQRKMCPRDFGLKVKQDPGSLIVTARNKMRLAKTIKCPITVSGHLLETPRLKDSNEVLKKNAEVAERFISQLDSEGTPVNPEDPRTNGYTYFWEGVSSEYVASLLNSFSTHPWHLSYNGKALAEYTEKHTWEHGWDVVLMTNGSGDAFPKKLEVGNREIAINSTEKRKIELLNDSLSVTGSKVRVGAGGCCRTGLTKEQIETAQKLFYENPEHKGKNLSDSAYLIEGRNPILMIHILDAEYVNVDEKEYPKFLYALGVGYPEDHSITDDKYDSVYYQVNLVELQNWIDPDDDEDE